MWDNQAGSQKWLPTPNARDRLNSDSPVVETNDMLWISLLDWISEPKGFVVQTRKKIRHNIASGESTECGITKLVVRNGSQLLTRAID